MLSWQEEGQKFLKLFDTATKQKMDDNRRLFFMFKGRNEKERRAEALKTGKSADIKSINGRKASARLIPATIEDIRASAREVFEEDLNEYEGKQSSSKKWGKGKKGRKSHGKKGRHSDSGSDDESSSSGSDSSDSDSSSDESDSSSDSSTRTRGCGSKKSSKHRKNDSDDDTERAQRVLREYERAERAKAMVEEAKAKAARKAKRGRGSKDGVISGLTKAMEDLRIQNALLLAAQGQVIQQAPISQPARPYYLLAPRAQPNYQQPQQQAPTYQQPPHLANNFVGQQQQAPYPPQQQAFQQRGPGWSAPNPVVNAYQARHPARPVLCNFCNDANHQMGACPHVISYLQQGMIVRDSNTGKITYRGGQDIRAQAGSLKSWVDDEERKGLGGNAGTQGNATAPVQTNAAHYNSNFMEYEWSAPSVGGSEHAVAYVDNEWDAEAKRARSETSQVDKGAPAAKRPDINRTDDFVRNIYRKDPVRGPFSKPNVGPSAGEGSGEPPAACFVAPPPLLPFQIPQAPPEGHDRDDASMAKGTVKTAKTTKTRGPAQFKYESTFESQHSARAVYDEILSQAVSLPFSKLLSVSPELAKLLSEEGRRRRVPNPKAMGVGNVNMEDEEGDESFEYQAHMGELGTSYAGPLGKVKCTINGHHFTALIDSGSQINLCSEKTRKLAGMPQRTDGRHVLRGAGKLKEDTLGICEDVEIFLSGLALPIHMYNIEYSAWDIILGVPFLVATQATISFKDDGAVRLVLFI